MNDANLNQAKKKPAAKKKKTQNCWEHWNCLKKVRNQCLAFKLEMGRKCWMIPDVLLPKNPLSPKAKQKFAYCWECPWFKEIRPDY